MPLSRRTLLQSTALAAASGLAPLPGLGRLLFGAQSQENRILVVLHLRGGCDGLNLLSPAADPDFIAARNSDLRVLADGDEAGHPIVHSQDSRLEFRLHAAAKSLAELADAKQLAFIHAAGLTDTTRSHFAATDMIERGVADGAALNRTPAGWLARAMGTLPGAGSVRGVSTSNAPSGAWTGDAGAISVADLGNGVGPPGGAQTGKVLQALYGVPAQRGGEPDAREAGGSRVMVGASGAVGTRSVLDTRAVISAGRVTLDAMSAIDARLARDARGKYLAYVPQAGVNYDAAYELGRPLRTLAELIKMDLGLQAATVDLGGWDTHEYQPGRFRNQVERLSQGLGAFYNDMTRYQDRLVVVVVTEFGRRLRSNRSNGTDHGRGSVMMVLGGRVAGGRIYGRWPGLKSEQLEEGVDLAVVNDYRQSLAEVISHWRGGSTDAADVFPGFRSEGNLGLFA
jgi:uncharacterized protein (DUF1501 family)